MSLAIYRSNNCPGCGSGHSSKCFAIYESSSHCFRCGYRSVSDDYSFSQKYEPTIEQDGRVYTKEFRHILTIDQIKLFEWGVFESLYTYFNIGYCVKDRVLRFELSNGIYQTRSMADKRFKSHNLIHRSFNLIKPIKAYSGDFDVIVVVEDYINAIRVSEAGFNALPLFGTNLSEDNLKNLLSYKTILLCLDPDDAGRKASLKLATKIDMLTKNYSYVKLNNVINCNLEVELKRKVKSEIYTFIKKHSGN